MKFPLSADDARSLLRMHGSPLYVYDLEIIRERCRALKSAFPTMRLYYACKANAHVDIIRTVLEEGLDIETVSPGEIAAAKAAGAPAARIAFTCANIPKAELLDIARANVRMHLDSLTQVEEIGRALPGSEVSVRLNLDIGAGHHAHTTTGGSESKFGIHASHIPALTELVKMYELRITGLHQHIGSGFNNVDDALAGVDALLDVAHSFTGLSHIDFGGGFGVPYAPQDEQFPLQAFGEAMRERMKAFSSTYGFLEMSFEPGRFVVAEAGVLLVTVTDIKRDPTRTFVGVDSGMGHLIRPMMYNSYHEVENLSRPEAPREIVTIGGYYCESGDVLAKDRQLPMPQLGDILAIRTVGAYGFAMSSDYNLRPKPKEIVLEER